MIILFVWVVCAILCLQIAGKKGLDKTWWFILGLIFGIFALVVLLLMPKADNKVRSEEFKTHLENAKRAEFKEQWEKAIDHYGDAMYSLGKARPSRKEDIDWCRNTLSKYKQRIEELKAKQKNES